MAHSILQANVENRGLVLDPRTKLLLMVTIATVVLGSLGSGKLPFLAPCLCAVPLILLLSSQKYKTAAVYAVVYTVAYLAFQLFSVQTTGIVNFLLLGSAGILTRFMPSIMMGMYVVSTTTVSESTAAMSRMHVSEKLIIPLSVMFRFFPTVSDEFSSINSVMRMRGISFAGGNAAKMLEYRLVPLMTCSAKIGDELSAAALTRGLGGDVRRTNVCRIGFHVQDWIMIVLCAVPFIYLLLSACGIM